MLVSTVRAWFARSPRRLELVGGPAGRTVTGAIAQETGIRTSWCGSVDGLIRQYQ